MTLVFSIIGSIIGVPQFRPLDEEVVQTKHVA